MKYISFIIGLVLSGAALYLTLINVPLHTLWEYFFSIQFRWVFISIGINYISFLIRAYRWQQIVKEIQPISFCAAYHPTAIAFMINCILPGRVGELARPAILYQKKRVPLSGGLSTIVTERLFDITILILLYALVFIYVDIDPNYQMEIFNYTLSQTTLSTLATHIFGLFIFLLVCIVCINVQRIRSWFKRIFLQIPRLIFFAGPRVQTFIAHKCVDPMINIMDHVAEGFSLLRRPARIIHCFFLSVVIWLLVAFSYFVMSFGCTELHISFFEMCAVLVMICFFISLPSVPGYWGLWEAGGVFAMTIFGIGEKEAVGFTLVNHAAQVFPIIVAGLISAFLTGTSIFSSSQRETVEKIQIKE
ncbi:MAG: flippase-like domain-containing protein [Candidatus Magnetomorum sp.]|nr:flippase-like domain-containing protein [Candidatus Magnetomorum sp.]